MSVQIDQKKCISCGACVVVCPRKALSLHRGIVRVDDARCISCCRCVYKCYMRAITATPGEKTE